MSEYASEDGAHTEGHSSTEQAERRIGVYVCHCGGNISDYVDVGAVVDTVGADANVVVARRAMFTCSDATQQEIIDDIREHQLDGLVVASCSPKLHTFTFRDVARRAGLNPYQYTQVNVREQCSWAHTDDREGATRKAIRLVRAGVARTGLTTPLEPMVVTTQPRALVIGGGIAGLRAAVGLAEIGLHVFLVEREARLGGRVAELGEMFPNDRTGRELIDGLVEQVRRHPGITVFTQAEVVSKSGSFGNYVMGVRVANPEPGASSELVQVEVGSVVVATGADTYKPEEGEYGYGIDGVLTLPEFNRLLDDPNASGGPLVLNGKPINTIAYLYCVGSRSDADGANPDCSRYCCTATVHASLKVAKRAAGVRQLHLYRDMRAYGRHEVIYSRSRAAGSVFLKVSEDEPPTIERDQASGKLLVTTRDELSGGEQVAFHADLVVLVTGMVPRANQDLVKALKLPIGKDGFFNEIHPKLRPVETVVDGVYICGSCQSPKTSVESVTSALAAVTQSASILKRGTAELDPMVARVLAEDCDGCGECLTTCPYDAIAMTGQAAAIDAAGCKGCGGCVPVCPRDAIELQGYTDGQVIGMIDGMLRDPAVRREPVLEGAQS